MIEVLFTIIILVLLAGFAWYIRESNKEKAKLVNALIAKDATEMTNLTLADQTTIKPEVNREPDLVPMDQVDDEKFDEHIQEVLNGSS